MLSVKWTNGWSDQRAKVGETSADFFIPFVGEAELCREAELCYERRVISCL